jgi:hypothetical protein
MANWKVEGLYVAPENDEMYLWGHNSVEGAPV